MADSHDTMGFVVNIIGPLDFCIDLNYIKEKKLKKGEYFYYEIPKEEFYLLAEAQTPVIKTRTAYHCHLRGIRMRKFKRYPKEDMIQLSLLIRGLFFRSDNWIYCHTYKADPKARLLVDIVVIIGSEPINLVDYILNSKYGKYFLLSG